MRRWVGILGVAVALWAPAVAGAGQMWAPATLAQYFRVEWESSKGAVSGYVTNLGNVPAERMQVLIEQLDAAGAVVGSTRASVLGIVPANQRSYFEARVPAAAAYRVQIVAFDWIGCRG